MCFLQQFLNVGFFLTLKRKVFFFLKTIFKDYFLKTISKSFQEQFS